MKQIIYLAFLAVGVSTYRLRSKRGIVTEAEDKLGDSLGETGYHHQIEHEHAKSHQSIKFEHFHPVPVYVKKEHSELLHHPVEKGKFEHNLKQIHPKHEHKLHHGGLVLEDHRFEHDVEHGYHFLPEQHSFLGERSGDAGHGEEQGEGSQGFEGRHDWGAVSGDHAGFEAQGLEGIEAGEGGEGHYQFQAEELSHLGLHEDAGEGFN